MWMNYRIVALDVDGTLLHDNHSLSETNKQVICEVASQGAEIVLCTGRSPFSTLPYLDQLGLNGVLITHNGAVTVTSQEHNVLHRFDIPLVKLDPYIAYCKSNHIHFDINTAFDIYVDNMEQISPEWLHIYQEFLLEPKPVSDWMSITDPPVKFTLTAYKEEIDQIEREFQQWSHELMVIRSADVFIDVMHKEATKGNALQQLAQMRGVKQEQVLAIGNYFNDVTMLQFAGMGIAMDNAPCGVKKVAKEVTLSNNKDGVAIALRKHCLAN